MGTDVSSSSQRHISGGSHQVIVTNYEAIIRKFYKAGCTKRLIKLSRPNQRYVTQARNLRPVFNNMFRRILLIRS